MKPALPTYKRLFLEPLGVSELVNIIPTWSILESIPKGNGEPVMVIPGLTTNDLSTAIIRTFLRSKNYNAYGWELGVNITYTESLERKLISRVDEIYRKHGQKVTLIGWSLGGVTMRIFAGKVKDKVGQLIALGAPFANIKGQTHVDWWYELLTGQKVRDFDPEWTRLAAEQPAMPSTAIYSKTDGMVSWEYCIDHQTGPITENVEVMCNHLGFGMNPAVWYIVCDRLRQSEGNWKPFNVEELRPIEQASLFHV